MMQQAEGLQSCCNRILAATIVLPGGAEYTGWVATQHQHFQRQQTPLTCSALSSWEQVLTLGLELITNVNTLLLCCQCGRMEHSRQLVQRLCSYRSFWRNTSRR